MKAILMSIKPKWCEKIFSGEKTVEVRKTPPKLETPFKVYVYCTKDNLLTKSHYNGQIYVAQNRYLQALEACGNYTLNGKVIGDFVCDRIDKYNSSWLDGEDKLKERTCLDDEEIMNYVGYTDKGFCLLHISSLKLYDEPKELGEFTKWCRFDGNDTICNLFCPHCDTKNGGGLFFKCTNQLTRAPQSWCYVEEI